MPDPDSDKSLISVMWLHDMTHSSILLSTSLYLPHLTTSSTYIFANVAPQEKSSRVLSKPLWTKILYVTMKHTEPSKAELDLFKA